MWDRMSPFHGACIAFALLNTSWLPSWMFWTEWKFLDVRPSNGIHAANRIEIRIGEGEKDVVDETKERGTKKYKKGSGGCEEKTYDRSPAQVDANCAR